MAEIIKKGNRIHLRPAEETDIDFIMRLEYAEENVKFIVPYTKEKHLGVIRDPEKTTDIIAAENDTENPVGYFMVNGLTNEAHEFEFTHVIIEKKGVGYGREALKLLKAWTFEDKKAHRAWVDCKDYNEKALHLYETEGFVREGLIRETLLTNGVYENLVILGILDREYFARKERGLEL